MYYEIESIRIVKGNKGLACRILYWASKKSYDQGDDPEFLNDHFFPPPPTSKRKRIKMQDDLLVLKDGTKLTREKAAELEEKQINEWWATHDPKDGIGPPGLDWEYEEYDWDIDEFMKAAFVRWYKRAKVRGYKKDGRDKSKKKITDDGHIFMQPKIKALRGKKYEHTELAP